MTTRTECYNSEELLLGIDVMETAGWAVRQVVVLPLEVFLVVYEREAA